jgi:hypothetical protein
MWARKWAILTLGPPALLVVGFVAFTVGSHLKYSPRSFDAERWRNGDARERTRMVGDLNRSQVLVGKTWGEVVGLLGPGDREDPGWLLEYELVHGSVFGWYEWRELLWVRFDPDTGRVREVTFFD